ncbi:DUF739 domain-containing protein [Peptococcus simiae]|uniref:DUF739 domain-containing protein n=1 Tax=Peptococcus simiae TaxID=1643805 RepID=A0ABW9H0H2_9FIRM
MINTNKLKGIIVENGKTQQEMAEILEIAPKTFYTKMKKGVFLSNEINTMINVLNIKDPMPIFFAKDET